MEFRFGLRIRLKQMVSGILAGLMMVGHSLDGSKAAEPLPEVWLYTPNYAAKRGMEGPEGWYALGGGGQEGFPDFMRYVKVVVGTSLETVPADVLARVFKELDSKGIAFGMESLAQSWVHQPPCGRGVEGYSDPSGEAKIARKIKAAGGTLAYVLMDEPLWFGHFYAGRNACHSTIANVAERAAALMNEYKKVFPNVAFYDIEPVPALIEQANWSGEYEEWQVAFEKAMGEPIKAFQIDVDWGRRNWPTKVREAAAFFHEIGMPLGVIYNGDIRAGNPPTNATWLASAEQHFRYIEGELAVVPNQAIFHSWDQFPTHLITMDQNLGEDYLVMQYARFHGEK